MDRTKNYLAYRRSVGINLLHTRATSLSSVASGGNDKMGKIHWGGSTPNEQKFGMDRRKQTNCSVFNVQRSTFTADPLFLDFWTPVKEAHLPSLKKEAFKTPNL